MAENKENLSTEQILSSIRDMLTDGDGEAPSSPDSAGDDVLELTADMVVGKEGSETEETAAEIVEEETIEDEMNSANLSSTPQETLVETVIEGREENKTERETIPSEKTEEGGAGINSEIIAANIIKTFSNMFSNIDIAADNLQAQPREKIDGYNEDALKSSISKAVENWVVENMHSDAGLQPLVREEVSRQVKVWLDGNLANLITASIRQELERVTAKVDNVQ